MTEAYLPVYLERRLIQILVVKINTYARGYYQRLLA
jgi:hypothetical protein